MLGWPGASQAGGDGFCWGAAWAPSQAAPPPQLAAPAAPPLARPTQANPVDDRQGQPPAPRGPPPPQPPQSKLQPQSRSGAAALSARRAQQSNGGAGADPFSFDDTAPSVQPAGQGWRGKGGAFLLGGSSAARAGRPPASHAASHAAAPPQPARQESARPPAASKQVNWGPVAPAAASKLALGLAPANAVAAPAPQALPPAPAVTLSLERYLEFWQLLTKGTGRVQPLTDLEKSILKATDLKQILLVNALNASSRSKKELQERLEPLQLFSPLCLLPEEGAMRAGTAGTATAGAQAGGTAAAALPDAEAMASLGWLERQVAAAATHAGSCCTLPPVRLRMQGGELLESVGGVAAGAAGGGRLGADVSERQQQALLAAQQPVPVPPEDSQVTMASGAPGCGVQGAVQLSPEVAQRVEPAAGAAGAPAAAVQHHAVGAAQQQQERSCILETQEQAAEEEEQAAEEEPEVAEWLVQGVGAVAERSQGSSDVVAGKQLLGRRVAFVLLEDLEEPDPRGIVDTVGAGVVEGQVVEPVCVEHDDECPPDCDQAHAFHYVRVPVSASTAPAARRAGRRLDLVIDLQEGLRQRQLEGLLALSDEEVQHAWVLLEPRLESDDDEKGGEGEAAMQIASGAPGPTPAQVGSDGGGWRIKRGAQRAAPAPAPKRQQAAERARRC